MCFPVEIPILVDPKQISVVKKWKARKVFCHPCLLCHCTGALWPSLLRDFSFSFFRFQFFFLGGGPLRTIFLEGPCSSCWLLNPSLGSLQQICSRIFLHSPSECWCWSKSYRHITQLHFETGAGKGCYMTGGKEG